MSAGVKSPKAAGVGSLAQRVRGTSIPLILTSRGVGNRTPGPQNVAGGQPWRSVGRSKATMGDREAPAPATGERVASEIGRFT